MSALIQEHAYIGCVSEVILKDKTDLYDVFIDCKHENTNQHRTTFHTHDPILNPILKVTTIDRRRLISGFRWAYHQLIIWTCSALIVSTTIEHIIFSLKEFIFTAFHFNEFIARFSGSQSAYQMTTSDLQNLNLHPEYDRLFLNELFRVHNISSVTFKAMRSFPYSPCCSCEVDN